jgi:hypothetical protein
MFRNSVIQHTGQMWKFILAMAALIVGSIAPLFPETGISWTAGTVLAVGGYAFGCFYIACPGCGKRWFWEALMHAEWYKPVLVDSICPACNRNYGES